MRTIEEAILIIEELIASHLGGDWRLKINYRFTASYGMCEFLTHIIHIAPDCAIHCTEDHLRQMVLHEIAHGLTHNVGHNKIFKAVCKEIGCKTDTPYFSDYASLSYLPK